MKELEPYYKEYIDFNLTKKVNEKKITKWLPFIGKNYNDAPEKVLIIGLSHYDLGKSDNWTKSLETKIPNIESITGNGLGIHKIHNEKINKNRMCRGLERVFFNISQKDIYATEFKKKREKFWTSIAFHQFIETPMQGSPKHNPKIENKNAYRKLIDLVKIIKPDHIIMLSNSYTYNQELSKIPGIYENIDKRAYENPDPKKTDIRTCYFTMNTYNFTFSSIVHPSLYKYINFQNLLIKRTMPKFLNYLKND